MRTIAKSVAVVCVIGASLAMPGRADACYTQTVLVSLSNDYSEVVASTNLQFDGWTCSQYIVSEVKAFVTLETPSGSLPEEYEVGYWQALATVSASYGEHGWGWYSASGYGEIKVDSPFSGTVPTDTDYDWAAVPGPPYIQLDGPTSVGQYGEAIVTPLSTFVLGSAYRLAGLYTCERIPEHPCLFGGYEFGGSKDHYCQHRRRYLGN
jgi:hypothetical protein